MKPKTKSSVKQLRAIQRQFATGVMRPLASGHRMQSKWTDGSSTRRKVAEFVRPNDRLTSYERIEIYNKQYWFRLLDCLYDDFPGLRSLLGNDRFHKMSIAYLTKYPSNTYALSRLGDRLEKFLMREPRWTATHPKLAQDIVRLEWAHIVAFDADEKPPLSVDALLDGGDPAKLRLGLQPYITFLACDFPVDNYVLGIRRREEPRGEASNAVAEHLPHAEASKVKVPKPEKIYLAVHRQNFSVFYKRLEPEAYRILTALQKGATLQAACERAIIRKTPPENFAATLQEWFAQWAGFGWFCRAE
jgi:hypothetical protein